MIVQLTALNSKVREELQLKVLRLADEYFFKTVSNLQNMTQQYHVVQLGSGRGGKFGCLGQQTSWVVHGSVHGLCMGAWWWWLGGGFINDVLYYPGLGLGGLVMVGPDHWGIPGLVVMSLMGYCYMKWKI